MMHAKIGKIPPGHMCKALSFLFVAVLFLLSTPVFADNILEIYKLLSNDGKAVISVRRDLKSKG